jgi:LytS/YehU family sensor histidine kinase
MTISLLAGVAYVFIARNGTAPSSPVIGGLIAGGLCAFIGILVSYLLGDVQALVMTFGTASSAVTGALGGWLGKLLTRRSSGVAAAVVFCLLVPSVHARELPRRRRPRATLPGSPEDGKAA